MVKESQNDNFVILKEDEIIKLQDEAFHTVRYGNHSLEKQFRRDIEYASLAIVDYGLSEQDKIKADMLLKSMLFLFFGQVCYRHHSDQRFHPVDTLNTYFKNNTTLSCFPIAAILLHGSRALIEFPSEIAHQVMDWLITDKNSWRYLATHGISALTEAERINNDSKDCITNLPIYKCLKEEKVNGTQAAFNFASDSIANLMMACSEFSTLTHTRSKLPEHYGIDLALGGVENQHFASKKIIQNNGEHGHLYINFYRGEEQHSGLLLGIEQSAPGKSDQYGGEHDLRVSDKSYSASGGDFFCKKPNLSEVYQKDYQGLSALPIAGYYDSLWSHITEDTFVLIKNSFKKCQCLLSLLRKEKVFPFIKHILSSGGGAKQLDFDLLFDHYFQEIPQVKVPMRRQVSLVEALQARHEQLLALCCEQQQAESRVKIQLRRLRKQAQSLEHEKETIKQESKNELNHLQYQFIGIQKEKNRLLFSLAKCFMQTVIQQMGWRANHSQKQRIMLSLQQLETIGIELNEDHIRKLLKNFIAISLMNRCGLKGGPTHSVKACVHYLNLPPYRPLFLLLFLKTQQIDYEDLLTLVAGDKVEDKQIVTSARYKNNLYRFYQEENTKNKLDQNKLILATQQLVYMFHKA